MFKFNNTATLITKLVICALLMALVCTSVIGCGDSSTDSGNSSSNVSSTVGDSNEKPSEEQEDVVTTEHEKPKKEFDKAYHDTIKSGIESGEISQNADKVVFLYLSEGMYSRDGLSSELSTESANEIRYIVNITEVEEKAGTYSGPESFSYAIKINYTLDMYDRIEKKTVLSAKIPGSDPPYINRTDKNAYGDLPTDEELGQWVSNVYQYRDNGFLVSYQVGDFKYTLSAVYNLEESESDTIKKYKTDNKSIAITYFSKSKYGFKSLSDFVQICKMYIEDENKQYVEIGLGTYVYGDITEMSDFYYFTYTKEMELSLWPDFSVIACYETDNGFCSVEIIGKDTNAESEYVEIATALIK